MAPCCSGMASEKPLVAVTCTAPVNIAVIKYCECAGVGAADGEAEAPRGGWWLVRVRSGDSPPRGRDALWTRSLRDVQPWGARRLGGHGP